MQVTLAVLTRLLFAVLAWPVGRFFGPVMTLWFGVLAALGLAHIAQNPAILVALNPVYALGSWRRTPVSPSSRSGSVVLCVTGARRSMPTWATSANRSAWLVQPGHAGAGAQLFRPGRDAAGAPREREEPFFEMAPTWALYPLIGMATAATVIASQALITAASVTKQAIQLAAARRACACTPR